MSMRKRLRKKIGKNRRRDIHRILDIVLDINGLKERKREKTGELPTAFLSFSGHVAKLYVDIHSHGWGEDEPYIHSDKSISAYTDNSVSINQMVKELEQYDMKRRKTWEK